MTQTTTRGTKHQSCPRCIRPGVENHTIHHVVDGFFEGDKDSIENPTGERSPPL